MGNVAFSQPGWVQLNSGTDYDLYSIHFTDVNNGFAVGLLGTICKTTNGGANWQSINLSPDYTFNSVWFINPQHGFVVGDYSTSSGSDAILYYTINGGSNWSGSVLSNPESDMFLNSLSFADTVTGYAVGYIINYSNNQINPLVMKTTNSGANWTEKIPAITEIFRGVFFVNPSTGFAVGTSGGVYKTTDGASSWVRDSTGYTVPFNSVYFSDGNTGYACGDYGKVIKTTNSGTLWQTVYPGGSNNEYIKSITFLKQNPSIGYVAADLGRLRRTTNYGVNWIDQISGTDGDLYSVYFVDSSNGYVTGQYGIILKTTTAGLLPVEPVSENVPSGYELYQNYPNPFNPSTDIEFRIAESGLVQLRIYDLLGREVATLVNRKIEPGKYSIHWVAGGEASGVYFYRLTAGDLIDVKKMVLLK